MASPGAFPHSPPASTPGSTPEPEEPPTLQSSTSAESVASLTPSITVRRPTLEMDGWEPIAKSVAPEPVPEDWKPPKRTSSIHSAQGIPAGELVNIAPPRTPSPSVPSPTLPIRSASPNPSPILGPPIEARNSSPSIVYPAPLPAVTPLPQQPPKSVSPSGHRKSASTGYGYALPIGAPFPVKSKPAQAAPSNVLLAKPPPRSPSPSPSLKSSASILEEAGLPYAGSQRNAEFHALFPNIPVEESLVDDLACGFHSNIMVQGRLYFTPRHICFYSSLWGTIDNKVIAPWRNVTAIEKRMQAIFFSNAIEIKKTDGEWFLGSFVRRDAAYDLLVKVWENSKTLSPMESACDSPTEKGAETIQEAKCACAEHNFATSMAFTYCAPVAEVSDVLFGKASDKYLEDFYLNVRKNREFRVEKPYASTPPSVGMERNLHWIVPLSGPIGPKQTRNLVTETVVEYSPDVVVVKSAGTNPDVPSGDAFALHTRICLTSLGPTRTRVRIGAKIVWSKSSWVKGLVESSAIEGVRTTWTMMDKQLLERFPPKEGQPDEGHVDVSSDDSSALSKVTVAMESLSATTHSLQDRVTGFIGGFSSQDVLGPVLEMHPKTALVGLWMAGMWFMVWRVWTLLSQLVALHSTRQS